MASLDTPVVPEGHDHVGGIFGLSFGYLVDEQLRVLFLMILPPLQEFFIADEERIVRIAPHARRVEVNDRFEVGHIGGLLQELVHLLLVLGDDKACLDADQGRSELARDGRGKEVERDCPEGLRPELGEEPFRVVVHDHAHMVVTLQPKSFESEAGVLHVTQIIVPGIGQPHAIGLFPYRDLFASEELSLFHQHLGKGVKLEGRELFSADFP